MQFDEKTDGYALLDWVADNNAVIKREDGRWLLVCALNGATLGSGAKPSDAIISAANNKWSNARIKPRCTNACINCL